MATTADITAQIGAANANLQKVEGNLFDVVKLQLHANIEGFNSPETYGIYKGTGGAPLGVMGKQFDPMQPKELLKNIMETSAENGVDLRLDTLKFNEYGGGRFIEFSVDLPAIEFKNARKVNDVTEMKLTFTTSFDGSQSNQIGLFSKRLICTNGMQVWGRNADVALKAKNTTGGKKRVLTYTNEVMKVMAGAETFKEHLEGLNRINVTQKDVDTYISKLVGWDFNDPDQMNSKRQSILDKINESVALEFGRTGATMFGLLNGITHYTNHVANEGGKYSDDEFIRFHSGYKMNNKAQQLAYAELN